MYIHTHVRVHIHSCKCILFICTEQSLYYMRVYHKLFFNTYMCAYEGIRKWDFFVLCSWLKLVAGVGGYVLAGVEIGGLSCIFLYSCGCSSGGWVCAYIRAYTHTHYLDT